MASVICDRLVNRIVDSGAAVSTFQIMGLSPWQGPRITILIPSYIATMLAAPLFPIAITLIYYDQRIRLEGFDIEWMMDAAGMIEPVPAQILTAQVARTPAKEIQP